MKAHSSQVVQTMAAKVSRRGPISWAANIMSDVLEPVFPGCRKTATRAMEKPMTGRSEAYTMVAVVWSSTGATKEAAANAVAIAATGGTRKSTIEYTLRSVATSRGRKNRTDKSRQTMIWRPVLPMAVLLASGGKSLVIFKSGRDFRTDAVRVSMAILASGNCQPGDERRPPIPCFLFQSSVLPRAASPKVLAGWIPVS